MEAPGNYTVVPITNGDKSGLYALRAESFRCCDRRDAIEAILNSTDEPAAKRVVANMKRRRI